MFFKKSVVLTVALLFAGFLYGQDFSFTYRLNLPFVDQKDSFVVLKSPEALSFGRAGCPQTLFYPVKLLLPPNTDVKTVKIEYQKPVVIRINKELLPFQGFQPTSNNFLAKKVKINSKIYQKDSLDLRKFTFKTAKYRNFTILLGNFSPIIYLPKQNEIKFFTTIKISVQLKKSSTTQNRFWFSPDLPQFIDNPQMLKNYQLTRPVLDYLIITDQNLKNTLDTLKTFYESKGYRVKILTTNTIDKTFPGQDLAEKIRNAIIDYFQNTGIGFVLLGGDIDIIPYRGFYCKVYSSQIYQSSDIPADIYYSGLDGTWNDDFDQQWAEPQEADLLLDVAVGRLPFDSEQEAKNMITKIINYQQRPVNHDLNKYLLIGEYLWNDPLTYGAQYLNLLIGFHNDSGYTTQGIPPTAVIDSLYDRDSTWDALDLLEKINQGYNFIFHCGHSNSTHLMRLSIDDITGQNFQYLDGTTHVNPIFYTHGCYAGAFDVSDCITEQMLKLPVATSAVVANSRYGWFNEGQADGPSEHLNREFVNAIFGLNQPDLGIDQLLSKNLTSPFVDLPDEFEFGATRWVYYDCNLLGDPLQQVWTDTLRQWTVSCVDTAAADQGVEINFADSLIARAAVWQDSCKLFETGFGKTQKITIPRNLAVNLSPLKIFLSAVNHHDTVITVQVDTPAAAYISATLQTYDLWANDTDFVLLLVKNIGRDTAINLDVQCVDNQLIRTEDITLDRLLPGQDSLIRIATFVKPAAPDSFETWLNLRVLYHTGAQLDTQMFNFPVLIHAPEVLTIVDSNIFCNFSTESDALRPFTVKNFGSAAAKLNLTISVDSQLIYQQTCQLAADSSLSPQVNLFQSNRPIRTVSLKLRLQLPDTIIEQHDTVWRIERSPDIDFSNTSAVNLFQYWGGQWTEEFTGFCNYGQVLQSPLINDNDSTVAQIQILCDTNDFFGFSYNVSSQKLHDYFKFYIDGQLRLAVSGQSNWKWFIGQLSPGLHTIKFVYAKDNSGYYGRDNVQIDNVFLPESSTLVSFNSTEKVKVYPNPFSHYLIVTLSNDTSAQATIYDMQGRVVMQHKLGRISVLNMGQLKTGVYILKLRTPWHVFRRKIIKQ